MSTLARPPRDSAAADRFISTGDRFRKRHKMKSWDTWVRHLANRRKPLPLVELTPDSKTEPLRWGLPAGFDDTDAAELIDRLGRSWRRGKLPFGRATVDRIDIWLTDADQRRPDTGYALECLAWAHALPRLAAGVPEQLWWELLTHLTGSARDAVALPMETFPLDHQLLAGELPLTLSYLLPEIRSCNKLSGGASDLVSHALVELLDGEGLLHCSHLPLVRLLLGCWSRCALMERHTGGKFFDDDARLQYEWFVRQALRLTRGNGSLVLSDEDGRDWTADLIDTALFLSDDYVDDWIADMVLPGRMAAGELDEDDIPPPGTHSEWAEIAVLRPNWSRKGERLTVAYGGRSIAAEMECGREILWRGVWDPQIEVNGRLLTGADDWEEICWSSDEDVDYLELEMTFADGSRVQRQLLIAREDHFLFAADAFLGREDRARIEYCCTLPMTERIAFRAAKETWEGYLVGRKQRGIVLPLALPEWRTGRRGDRLSLTEAGLEMALSARGRNLYAPLFVDLEPRRSRKPLTWRQLTIAENLEIQSPETAVGYRVQIGGRQWLIYRSLAERGNRTVLGHNLSSEFLVARFDRAGDVQPLLEIE